jgi:tetratricopeptide (TPR) repeat protein
MWVTIALLCFAGPADFAIIEKLIAEGSHKAALVQLENVPDTALRHLLASKAYDGLGDAANAVSEAEAALARDPRFEAAHLQLGQLFLSRNTPQAAFDIFSEALGILPDSLLLRLGRGIALKDLARYDEAEKDLLECLRRKPDLGLAFDALATSYLHSKRWEEAQDLSDRHRKEHPNDYRGPYFAAAAREGLKQPFASIEPLLLEALRLNPGFAAAHALLGKLLLAEGRPDRAIPVLEEAVRLRSDYAPALLHLAQAYQKAGRSEQAAGAYERFRNVSEEERKPRPALKYHRGEK